MLRSPTPLPLVAAPRKTLTIVGNGQGNLFSVASQVNLCRRSRAVPADVGQGLLGYPEKCLLDHQGERPFALDAHLGGNLALPGPVGH